MLIAVSHSGERHAPANTRRSTGKGRERAVARGVRLGRKPTLTPHQKQEAIKRLNTGKEAQGEIA